MLNYVFSLLMKDRDAKGRRQVEMWLLGRIGENGGEIIEDDELHESMQGLEAPSWWNSDHDPFEDMQRVGSSDAPPSPTSSGVNTL